MTTMLPRTCIVAGALFVAVSLLPGVAQAQYVASNDFEVSWTLDPRDDTALFDHGPDFGASRVQVGMDFDGDGNKEFLFATDESLAPGGSDPANLDIYLYENTGDNTYEHVWHYTHEPSNSLPALAYGDIDDDGKWEIYFGIPTVNDDPNDVFIFEQDDQGVFPDTPTVSFQPRSDGTLDFRPSGIQIVDADGDGQKEMVLTSRTSGARELLIVSPDAGLDDFATFSVELDVGEATLGGGGIYDVFVVDFDDDGLPEVWVNTWDNWSMTIFEATAADTYVMQVDLNAFGPGGDPGSFNAHNMHFVDTDTDGKLEGIFPMTDGVYYYLDNVTDVSALTGTEFVAVGRFGGQSRGGDVGDIDGDGLFDIIVGTQYEETVERIEYDGVGDPADSTSYSWTTIFDSSGDALPDRYYPLKIADDMDGDGNQEVVIPNQGASDTGQLGIIIIEHVGGGTAIERGPAVVDGFTLHANYPNPFADQTTVVIELDRPADVAVEVFDVTGRRVQTLASGTMSSGKHELRLEAHRLPAGLYLIRMDTPAGALTRTAMLVR